MARKGAKYSSYNGTKLEYKKGEEEYSRIYGLKTIPDLDGNANYISTTDLDNERMQTQQLGLSSAVEYEFEFNMEDPNLTSNIYLANKLEDSDEVYDWKLTLKNGIEYTFQSDVRTKIKGGQSDELIGFSMFLSPISEPQRNIPIENSI